MVGYNDAYNRALTAKSNALQRRKGQMVDRLNGSGRGVGGEGDDYLSEDEEMEGGGAYADDYENEMIGGSFEEASREVGGAMSYGGRNSGGRNLGDYLTSNPSDMLKLPADLASNAASSVGNLLSNLFGGAYSGGARNMKLMMMKDLLKSHLDKRLKPALPIFTDMAHKIGMSVMKRGGRASGGRVSGGKMAADDIAHLAALAIPHLVDIFQKLFNIGKGHPVMRGRGFFDTLFKKLGQIPREVANVLGPAFNASLPYLKTGFRKAGEFAKDELLPIAIEVGKEAFKDELKGALKRKPKGKGIGRAMSYGGRASGGAMSYGGGDDGSDCQCCGGTGRMKDARYRPPMVAEGGNFGMAMRAQDGFDREDDKLRSKMRGDIVSADRRQRERVNALGAGGKRLYMKGGQAPVAAMGQESLYGYDNDEQPSGLLPPRNVATRGYVDRSAASGGRRRRRSGADSNYGGNPPTLKDPYGLDVPDAYQGEGGAMPMYSCGGRALTPVDQMYGTIGGRASGGRASAWITHVKAYASKHGVSYKDALSQASATYRK